MKKLLLAMGIIILICSMSMCITSNNIQQHHKINEINNIKNKEIVILYNNTPIEVPLRASVDEAKKVKLINTTDKEIYDYYHSKILIYIQGNLSLKPEEGGISIIDLITKLKWFNKLYPHNIVVEINRTKSNVTAESFFANGKTSLTVFKINESEFLMNNNKTMVIKFIKSQNNATISRINNTFIIEGNSLKEMDKAETRFIIALLKGKI